MYISRQRNVATTSDVWNALRAPSADPAGASTGSRSSRRMKRSAGVRRSASRSGAAVRRLVVSSPVAMRAVDARACGALDRHIARAGRRRATTSAGVVGERPRRRPRVSSSAAAVAPQHADAVDAVDLGAVHVVVAVADHHDVRPGVDAELAQGVGDDLVLRPPARLVRRPGEHGEAVGEPEVLDDPHAPSPPAWPSPGQHDARPRRARRASRRRRRTASHSNSPPAS